MRHSAPPATAQERLATIAIWVVALLAIFAFSRTAQAQGLPASDAVIDRPAVLIQNVAEAAQDGWVFVGLPPSWIPEKEAGWLRSDGFAFPWVREARGIHVWASLPPNSLIKLFWLAKGGAAEPFAFHPAVTRDLLRITPTWSLGGQPAPITKVALVRESSACQVWMFTSHWPTQKVTLVSWCSVYSGQSTIPFCSRAIYGTTANDGQPQTQTFGAMVQHSSAKMVADFAVRNGHAAPVRNGESWSLTLVPDGARWHRASRYEVRGIITPVPDPVREVGLPLAGLSMGWPGNWMVFGKVPDYTPDIAGLRVQQLRSLRAPNRGSYLDPRPRTQTPNSGQTGEQPDFGFASDLAVVSQEPWECWDAIWQCQSYAIRPTCNREPGGDPLDPLKHPQAELLNQRPDGPLGVGDRIGWPGANQIEWFPSLVMPYSTADAQHRADNFLHASIALTGDPALEALVYDHIALDKLDVYLKTGRSEAPRATGRLALTRANQVWLGFRDAGPLLRRGLEIATQGVYQTPGAAMRVIGPIEDAKYGWFWAGTRTVIYGPQGWQQAIAAGGFRAGGMALREPAFTEVAVNVARTATRNFWLQRGGSLMHCYAMRWNGGSEWAPTDWPTSFRPDGEGNTDQIYVSGAADYWTASVAPLAPSEPNAIHVKSVWGQPRNATQARWFALQ